VHCEVQLAGDRVPVQRDDVARAGDKALAVLETLVGLVRVEAPDAGVILQERAGSWPGEPRVRSSTWQAFDGAPTLT
jgi:hypothetical protein